MVSFDIVADSIARINNAQMAKHLVTKLKFAKKIFVLMKVLCSLGYIKNFKVEDSEKLIYNYLEDINFDIYRDKNKYDFFTNISKIYITVELKYYNSPNARKPQGVIQDLVIISKQGRRRFTTAAKLKISPYKNNMGSIIVSTSKGLMSAQEASKLNLGGEQILKVF